MKRIQALMLLGALLCPSPAHGQQRRVKLPPLFCSADASGSLGGGEAAESEAEPAVLAMAAQVVRYAGLPQNFTIKSYDGFNAAAGVIGDRRVIYYDPQYLKALTQRAGHDRAAIGIMAHEIGHHLLGHTIEHVSTGSTPKLELEADDFAGFILGKMDASLEQAKSGFDLISPALARPNSTHPEKALRLSAVEKGWARAKSLPDPGRTPPIVPENLAGPVRQLLAGTRDGFSKFRGPALVTSGSMPTHRSTLVPPALQNWEIFIYERAGRWTWTARNGTGVTEQEAQNTYNAILSAVRNSVPPHWIHYTAEVGASAWGEPGTDARVGVGVSGSTVGLYFSSRVAAFSPDEPEYRARLKSIVAAARNDFRGMTEASLKDAGLGQLPHDAYSHKDIRLHRSSGHTSLRWTVHIDGRRLSLAHYNMVLRAVTELFPSFKEHRALVANAKSFRDKQVWIDVRLVTNEDPLGDSVEININYFGKD